jgi:hypothetical protein
VSGKPTVVLAHIPRQLNIPVERFANYEGKGRSTQRHCAHIRQLLGFREAPVQHAPSEAEATYEQIITYHLTAGTVWPI